ncbi:MAG: O-antigen ligase family protein [Chitinophagaceae bacterium]|nr:O-antigen ligase family protein [Bacteroidota bacterium]MBK9556170.1 O-antigen ligase family protein [Bacteroidota bacterium]MBL0278749.1 O-antigen ligase family protein [Bacteroidota bacterium]MBP9879901.1 O-antigen ligase family protein [Chitinophagales bacterium]
MRSLLRVFPNQFFASLAILGLIVGLVTSKVVLSVATIMIMCNAIINLRIAENFKKWIGDTTSVLLIALFLVYLLTGFYSDDTGYWVDRCRMKLPFLALPLGFTTVKTLTHKRFQQWLAVYFYVIVAAAIVVCINYLFHFDTLNEQLTKGQPIPAPLRDHIRFSLEMAFAVVVGIYLWNKKFSFGLRNEKYVLGAGILFLTIFIHVFAVRSGILTMYIAFIVMILYWLFTKKAYLQGIVALIVLAGFAISAVMFIPSLHARMLYFKYEMDLIKIGELHPEHSDAQRLLSIQYGVKIAEENPLLGVGVGDIKTEMDKLYNQSAGSEFVKSKLPHNQFVYFLAASGIVGFLVFMLSVLYPWFSHKRFKNMLYSVFILIMLISFMAEHTLEIQIGTAFYLLFLLLIKKYIDDTAQLAESEKHYA